MGVFQACTAALDAPCSPLHKEALSVPLQDDHFRHSSLSSQVTGGIEEESASFPFDCGGKSKAAADDESAISTMEMTSDQSGEHHFYHSPAVEERVDNFGAAPSKHQNGDLFIPSAMMESHSSVDPSVNNYHPAGLQYPQLPGHAGYLDPNLVKVLADLEQERKKNAELQSRVSILEAQLGSDDKHVVAVQNGHKKVKKQKRVVKAVEDVMERDDARKGSNHQPGPPIKLEENGAIRQSSSPSEATKPTERQDSGVTWMSRDEDTATDLEKLSKEILSERDDSGDSDDDEEEEEEEDEEEEDLEADNDGEAKDDGREKKKRKPKDNSWKTTNTKELPVAEMADVREEGGNYFALNQSGERDQVVDESECERKKFRKKRKRKDEKKTKRGEFALATKRSFEHMVSLGGRAGTVSGYRKAPKTAFCPKEVKRIMESGVLGLNNAQSHTMRKIVVFASLGIRHGCEDLYELDISHFSVVQRGEPYKSPKEPGEHVLYDYPGVRTKVFYPNRQNTVLCPVRILDEEKAMRPVGLTCPPCLFLCIKYGGRTRNLPQNEYVRQRMGRNKLKSFGPLMCQMALLVHIRTGSFFFKALGITLLFMAGFPDDLVRKETKYRNLDLLQKYYRTDQDSKVEQLFHPYPPFYPQAIMGPQPVAHKSAILTKVPGKKGPPPLLSKPPATSPLPRYLQSMPPRPPTMAPFRGLSPAFSPPLSTIPSALPRSAAATGITCPPGPPGPGPSPFGMYPTYPPVQQPPRVFPAMPWASVNSYPPVPYAGPPPFPYQAFSHPHFVPPFYNSAYQLPPHGQHPGGPELRKDIEAEESEDSESDSDSKGAGHGRKNDQKGDSSDSKDGQ